jgi:hypothetical protein
MILAGCLSSPIHRRNLCYAVLHDNTLPSCEHEHMASQMILMRGFIETWMQGLRTLQQEL